MRLFDWAVCVCLASCGCAGAHVAPAEPQTPHTERNDQATPLAEHPTQQQQTEDESKGAASQKRSVRGRLPAAVIQQTVRSNFGRFRQCYEDGMGRDPELRGTVVVMFVINLEGRVVIANALDDTNSQPKAWDAAGRPLPRSTQKTDMPDHLVVECVVEQYKQLVFPPPNGGIVSVVYPLRFEPDSGT